MTSKLIVNELAADTGISTITVGDNMSGVTFKTGTSNLHATGYECTNVNATGIITATTFVGNVTGNVTGTSSSNAVLTGSTDNTLVTVTGANAISGEAALTFDGSTLQNLQSGAGANLTLKATSNSFNQLILDSNRAADTQFAIIDGKWNGNVVNRIQFVTGGDGSNKDDGYMAFHTRKSGESLGERLRISDNGSVGINTTTSTVKLSVDGGTTNNLTAVQIKNDSTSAYATTDGGLNTALSLYSDGTNAAQSVGIQLYLQKSGQTGAISEIGAIREGNGLSGLVFKTRDSSSGVNERLRIDSAGMSKFTRGSTGTVAHFYANARECNILLQNDAQTWKIVNYDYGNDGTDNLGFHDGTADRLVIKKGGNIGINDTSPDYSLDVNGTGRFTDNLTINTTKKIQTNSSTGQLTIQGGATYPGSAIKFAGGQSGATDRGILKFYSSDTTSLVEVAEIRPDKKVQGILVGRREYSVSMSAHTTWYYVCTVHGSSLCSQVEFGVNGTRDSTVFNAHFDVLSTHAAPQYQVTSVGCNYTAVYMKMQGNNYGSYNVYIKRSGTTGACTANVRVYPRMNEYIDENEDSGYTSTAFEVTAFSGKRIWSSTANNADLDIHGNLSKGSGSFKIPHPLTSLKDTKNLVHSFIEGPSCDLIYRGTVTLSSGSATVNIDTVAGMTAGTFAALNKNVQCFTTNESGWGAVKGSVSGNILTITAQDGSSTDNVSWMIVGQRKDDVIKGSSITDANGDLVLEPSIDVTEASPSDSYPSNPNQYDSP